MTPRVPVPVVGPDAEPAYRDVPTSLAYVAMTLAMQGIPWDYDTGRITVGNTDADRIPMFGEDVLPCDAIQTADLPLIVEGHPNDARLTVRMAP